MIYKMICSHCDFETEWMCSVKEYETRVKTCPTCQQGILHQDYNSKNIGVTIEGFSYNNHYGLKGEKK